MSFVSFEGANCKQIPGLYSDFTKDLIEFFISYHRGLYSHQFTSSGSGSPVMSLLALARSFFSLSSRSARILSSLLWVFEFWVLSLTVSLCVITYQPVSKPGPNEHIC